MPKKTKIAPKKPITQQYPFKAPIPDWADLDDFKKKHPRVKHIMTKYLNRMDVRFATAAGNLTYQNYLSRMHARQKFIGVAVAPEPMDRRKEDKFLGTDIAITMSKADWEELSCSLADQICWNNGFEAARPDGNNGLIATGRLKEFNRRIKSVIHKE